MFKDKVVLIIGGSGRFGIKLCQVILQRHPEIQKVIIYSRNKNKQAEAGRILNQHPKLKFYLGDILHKRKLARYLAQVDYVVTTGCYGEGLADRTGELLRTYIKGTENIIEASLARNVAKVLTLSTPQACDPISSSGLAQLCGEKLIIAANNISHQEGKQTIFSVLRYGRAISGAEGIVGQLRKQQETGCLSVTDVNATRYWFTPENGAAWVLKSLTGMRGGEIIIPQTPSVRLLDLAKIICPHCQVKLAETKPGEKLHDLLITPEEAVRALEASDHYLIQPDFTWWDKEGYQSLTGGRPVAESFYYSSANNNYSLSVEELKIMLRMK